MSFNIFNIITLFGAVQGFVLCMFLFQKRKRQNILAFIFFLLFLFSLSFSNLFASLIDMGLLNYYPKLDLFPIPYDWLIGIGFYLYVKSQFPSLKKEFITKKESYIWIPAVFFLLLKTYLLIVAIIYNDYNITSYLIAIGFFKLHLFLYLLFSLAMGIASLKILDNQKKTNLEQKYKKNLHWLRKLTYVFIGTSALSFVMHSLDFIIHEGNGTWTFYYPILIVNAIFIYWIGYHGFIQFTSFFSIFKEPNHALPNNSNTIIDALHLLIKEKEIFKDPKVSLTQTAVLLSVTPKKLSAHIKEYLGMSFSEFMNYHRVEKIKALLTSSETEKYTLIALAQIAGFRTKSSFNTTFKKHTGCTPSEYKRKHQTN